MVSVESGKTNKFYYFVFYLNFKIVIIYIKQTPFYLFCTYFSYLASRQIWFNEIYNLLLNYVIYRIDKSIRLSQRFFFY